MNLLRDVRYGLRILARNPSYAAAALAVMALGIGASTAVFTVVRAVLLEPLPYRDIDRLVILRADGPNISHMPALTGEEFFGLRDSTDVFEEVATVNDSHASITGVDDMEAIPAASISDNLLPLLGVAPVLGRQVSAKLDLGDPFIRAVNVSYELWQRRWQGDPALVGRHIEVNNIDVEVVGVMPRGFRTYLGAGTNLSERVDIWFPGAPDFSPTSRNVPTVARLRAGVSVIAAQQRVDAFMQRFMAGHPTNYRLGPVKLTLLRLDEDLVHEIKPALLALSGAVAFVLFVACANLTNLMLARAHARTRELAVRKALGASRFQLVAQLATESVVLWGLGAFAGLLVAQWGVDALLRLAPAALPRREHIGIDGGVGVFALGVSLICALVFGLVPACHATRQDAAGMLKQDPATAPGAATTRGLLVAAQLALSLMLLVGAGLMARAFVSLRDVSLGFDPTNVLTMAVDVHHLRKGTPEQRLTFYNQVAEAVRQIPGVTQAAVGLPVPLSDTRLTQRYIDGRTGGEQLATNFIAMPGYAETLRVPVRAGATFTDADSRRADPVILVDERLASLEWPGQNAVGRRLLLGPATGTRQWAEVVGVVAHVQTQGLRDDVRPQIWSTYASRPFFEMGVAVRSAGNPLAFAASVKRTIEALGPQRPVTEMRLLEDYVADASADTRFALFVLGVFAVVALVLTAIGVYGVVSYATARRTREIAVRLALGADARRIVMLVLRDGAAWTVAGVAAGLAGAFALSRYLAALLFNVGARDPLTFAAVAALLALVALIATTLPAIQAVRIDPMIALRTE